MNSGQPCVVRALRRVLVAVMTVAVGPACAVLLVGRRTVVGVVLVQVALAVTEER